jgi:hypothetical protein
MQLLPEKKFTKKVMFRIDSPVLLFVEEQFSEGGEIIKSSKKRRKSKKRKKRLKPVHVKSDLETRIKRAMTTDKLDDFGKIDDAHLLYENGMMHYKGKVYIPPTLRERIMKEGHDAPIAGHPGITKTLKLIKRNYWWPLMNQDIEKYVKGCDSCQRNKTIRQPKATELRPHDTPTTPWESISVDIVGPLPVSNSHNAILAVIDRFSKMIRLIPTTTELTSAELVKIY